MSSRCSVGWAGLTHWTRSSVAALETAGRNLTADELLAMPVVLSLAGLGDHSLAELIQLGDDETWAVRVWAVREAITPAVMLGDAWPEQVSDMYLIAADDGGEAERKVALQLGVSMREVSRLSEELWGGPFTWARDVKVRSQAEPGASDRTIQALRGHVTRAMAVELAEVIREGKQSA